MRDLVARDLGRIRTPGVEVDRTEDRDHRRLDGGGEVDRAAVVGNQQLAATNECRQRLRRRGGRHDWHGLAQRGGYAGRKLLLVAVETAQNQRLQAARCVELTPDAHEALRCPAAGATEGARARGEQHGWRVESKSEFVPAGGGPALVLLGDDELESRTARVVRAEPGDHLEPVVHFVPPAEAVVFGGVGQETPPTAIVEPDAHRCPARPGERRVLRDAEARRQVVQQDERIPAAAPQTPPELDRARRASQRVERSVEADFVERNHVVDAVQPREQRRCRRRGQHRDMGMRKTAAQRPQRRRDREQVAQAGELDYQHPLHRARF